MLSGRRRTREAEAGRDPPRRPTSTRPAGPSRHAIDGNTATAWGIYPQVGKPHEAVFELAEAVGGDERTRTHVPPRATPRRRPPDRPLPAVGHDAPQPPVKVALLPDAIRADPGDAGREANAGSKHAIWPLHVLREQIDAANLPRCRPRRWSTRRPPNFAPDGSHKPVGEPRDRSTSSSAATSASPAPRRTRRAVVLAEAARRVRPAEAGTPKATAARRWRSG